uniref:Uncharacterized protein n=1 Tax=Nelumbo nucifera TaxID=4432 RepID=A0A822YXR9_NELNU|nr:TPA_asm: hypothetical protein HUJ06_007941 [Nelumbo nucifera]
MAFNIRGHEVSFTGKFRPLPGASIQTVATTGICHIKEAHRVRVVDVTYPEYHHAIRRCWNLQRDMGALMQENLALRQQNLELGHEVIEMRARAETRVSSNNM